MSGQDQSRLRAMATVRALTPYRPGKPISELERELGIRDSVKLASNENPLGASPRAIAAARAALDQIGLYPDGNGFALKRALADRLDIAASRVTLGNGSNDVLDLIARAFLGPGRNAVFSEHAFAVYPIVTQLAGAAARVVSAHDGSHGPRFGHDAAALAAAVDGSTGVVFIANPNNPTGTWLNAGALEGLLDAVDPGVVVVVDEAYFEYVDEADYPDTSRWLHRYPNLVVTRTFSKAYGLASLRVGYALSSTEIADLLNRARQPFNVNSAALAAAEAALGDEDFVARSRAVNAAGHAQIAEGCQGLDLRHVPSVGNFMLVEVGDAAQVYQSLLYQGVIVRPVENYGLPKHLRVTVGTTEQNARFLEALAGALGR